MSDVSMKEAILREAQRRRRQAAGLIVLSAGLALLLGPLAVLETVEGMARVAVFALMAAGLAVFLGGFTFAFRHKKNANSERVAMQGNSRDRVQREYAAYVGFLPVGTLLMNFIALRSTWDLLSGRGDLHDWGFAAVGPMGSLVILQVVAGLGRGQDRRTKRLLDDELVASFRQRGLNAGFAVAVAGLVIGFGAGLYEPAWGVMAMPITLAVAAAVAAFRYAMLDRQADPNG